MKTYEEALQTVCKFETIAADTEADFASKKASLDARAHEEFAAVRSRTDTLADEIMRNDQTMLLVQTFVEKGLDCEHSECSCLHAAMLALFINGVIVGIEMEKQQL